MVSFPDERAFEGLYNLGGYACFSGYEKIRKYSGANSIYSSLVEESKYFFIFPEDAIVCSNFLLLTDYIRLVEYNIPDEMVLKYAGIGRYGSGYMENGHYVWPVAVETAVGISNFGNDRIKAGNLSKEEKTNLLLKLYKETIALRKYYDNVDCSDTDENLLKSDEFEDVRFRICLYNYLLAKSDSMISNIYGLRKFDEKDSLNMDMTLKYLQQKGLVLDYSKKAIEERQYITQDLEGVDETLCMFDSYSGNKMVRERLQEYMSKKKSH